MRTTQASKNLGGIVAAIAIAIGIGAPTGPAHSDEPRPSALPYAAPDGVPDLGPDYRRGRERSVTVSDHDVQPRVLTLEEGQTVAWHSRSKATSTIVFEREVARDMICRHLVNFSIQEDEVRSAPLHTGETASFCELKPGKYRYRVVRPNPLHAGAGGAAHRLDGWIVVDPRPATPDADLAIVDPVLLR